MNGTRRGKSLLFSVVVMVMVENRLLLAHAHHVSKLLTGVEIFFDFFDFAKKHSP